MHQEILDLLALRGRADLIQLVKHHYHRHRLRRHQRVHNLAAVRALIDDLVARIGAGIRVAAERDKLERPAECLGNAVLDQTRLANARRPGEQERQPPRARIRDLAGDELENLDLRLLLAVDGLVQAAARTLHEMPAALRAIRQLHGDVLIDTQRQRGELLQPRPRLEILAAPRVHTLQGVVARQNHGLDLGADVHGQDLEHHGLRVRISARLTIQGSENSLLLIRRLALELVNLIVNAPVLLLLREQLDETIDFRRLLLHIVALGDHPVIGLLTATAEADNQLVAAPATLVVLVIVLIVLVILLLRLLFLLGLLYLLPRLEAAAALLHLLLRLFLRLRRGIVPLKLLARLLCRLPCRLPNLLDLLLRKMAGVARFVLRVAALLRSLPIIGDQPANVPTAVHAIIIVMRPTPTTLISRLLPLRSFLLRSGSVLLGHSSRLCGFHSALKNT